MLGKEEEQVEEQGRRLSLRTKTSMHFIRT
jgi:hypothetical protein